MHYTFLVVVSALFSIIVLSGHASATTGPLIITSDTVLRDDVDCTAIGAGPCITVGANNITLDCNRHTVTGPGLGSDTVGILLPQRTGVTVENCVVTNFGRGVAVRFLSAANRLISNTAVANLTGFLLDGCSSNNTLTGNTVNGTSGIGFHVGQLDACTNLNVLKVNATNITGSGFVVDGNNNTLENNSADGGEFGFTVEFSAGNTLNGNTARNNVQAAFWLRGSASNTLTANMAIGKPGTAPIFLLDGARGETLTGNTSIGGGFLLGRSTGNSLTANKAEAGFTGFSISESDHNSLTSNSAHGNSQYGFLIGGSFFTPSTANIFTTNSACGNKPFDAAQGAFSPANVYVDNHFCTTSGI